MRKREYWQIEAVLIGMILLGIIGLWLTRGIPDS
jgi:preprotein translocase subunit Sss1